MTTSEAAPKPKGMCIATRCTSVDQFVEMFHRFVDEDSFFVSTVNTRPPGLETSFSVQLADGTPVLRGLCVVLQAWTTATSPFKTPGVRLGIKRLTANSMPVFERLLVTRSKPAIPPPPPPPSPALAAGTAIPAPASPELSGPRFTETGPTKVAARPEPPIPEVPKVVPPEPEPQPATTQTEQRVPGSDLVLPANPLMNLTDASLEGYVDCTLYEETGTFFPVDDEGKPIDDLVPPPVPPPVLVPRPVARVSTPVEIVADEPLADRAVGVEVTFKPPRARDSAPAIPAGDSASAMAARDSAPAIATRDSSPAIAARDSAPAIAARDSAPAIAPPEPPPVAGRDSNPAFPAREITPAGELASPVLTQPRRGRWYVIGGVLTVGAAAAIWFGPLSSSDATPDTPTPVANQTKQTIPSTEGSAAAAVEKPAVDPPDAATPDPVAPDSPEEPPITEVPEGSTPLAGEGPCKVTVTSTPAGSIVILDGKAIAPSPVTIATTCGAHKIDIRHPRYQLGSRPVVLAADKPRNVDITLQRPTHTVSVTSQPSGATIYINGQRAGTTPTVLSVLGFSSLKLEIKKTGYAPVSTKLYSKVPQDKFTVKLTKW